MIKMISDKWNSLDNVLKFLAGSLIFSTASFAVGGAALLLTSLGFVISRVEKGKELDDYIKTNYDHDLTNDDLLKDGEPNILIQTALSDKSIEEKHKIYDDFVTNKLHLKKINK